MAADTTSLPLIFLPATPATETQTATPTSRTAASGAARQDPADGDFAGAGFEDFWIVKADGGAGDDNRGVALVAAEIRGMVALVDGGAELG